MEGGREGRREGCREGREIEGEGEGEREQEEKITSTYVHCDVKLSVECAKHMRCMHNYAMHKCSGT